MCSDRKLRTQALLLIRATMSVPEMHMQPDSSVNMKKRLIWAEKYFYSDILIEGAS